MNCKPETELSSYYIYKNFRIKHDSCLTSSCTYLKALESVCWPLSVFFTTWALEDTTLYMRDDSIPMEAFREPPAKPTGNLRPISLFARLWNTKYIKLEQPRV